MIILGIDPGIAKIGFGVLKKPKTKSGKLKALDSGCITTSPNLLAAERLKKIYNAVLKLITKYKPGLLAIENIYFFKNSKTAMGVSQAKGVILLAAAKKKIPVCELAPLEVKMAISGYGRADKKQIQKMVKLLLNLKKTFKSDDEADALGIAISGFLKTTFKKT